MTPNKNGKAYNGGHLTDQKTAGYTGGVMSRRLGSNKSNRLQKQQSDPNQFYAMSKMSNEALQQLKNPQSILSMSNGFMSTQKLQNRAGISPSLDHKNAQFSLLN